MQCNFLAVVLIFWVSVRYGCFSQDSVSFQTIHGKEEGQNDFTFEGIPESLLLQMKHIRNISQFFRKFILPSYAHPQDDLGKSFSNLSNSFSVRKTTGLANDKQAPNLVNARKALIAAGLEVEQFAGCRPELQVVKLEKPSSSAVMLWPPCVRARRCGGCCTSKLLECRPVEVQMSNITVLQVRYNPYRPDAFESEGLKTMTLEQHDRCVCGCKERADQCIEGLQEYRSAECRCVCLNIDQALQCSGPERMWDSGDCSCKCRYPAECSTGFFFSFLTCRCEVFRVPMLAAFRPVTMEQSNFSIQMERPYKKRNSFAIQERMTTRQNH